jgi:hypothetical protein
VTRVITSSLAGAAAAMITAAVLSAAAPETFSATASVKKGGASASAPVKVNVTRYATDAEREAAIAAVKKGGTPALKALLATKPDVGYIELGDKRTAVKFAMERPSGGGRLITVVTAEPILYLGAKFTPSKAVTGFDVALAMFEVQPSGPGIGDISPAAKVALDDKGALVVADYGEAVVWLNNIAAQK